jgi:predicted ATP-grasp superfamily ATP-dependent carboligase
VVKPRGQVGGGGGVHFVRTAQALDDAINSVHAAFGEPLITDYVPSMADDVRAVHLLFDGNSRLVGYFIVRKLCLWPPDIGLTAAAISTHETDLVERLLPLFRTLRWRGPAEAEFKIDARTSTPVLLEINPRFSGAISFPLRCGVNLAALFCEAAMGRELDVVQAPQYDVGIKYVNPSLYARVFSHRIRSRGVRGALRALRADLGGKRAGTVFQLSDLRPLIGKLLLQLRELRTRKVNQPHAN